MSMLFGEPPAMPVDFDPWTAPLLGDTVVEEMSLASTPPAPEPCSCELHRLTLEYAHRVAPILGMDHAVVRWLGVVMDGPCRETS